MQPELSPGTKEVLDFLNNLEHPLKPEIERLRAIILRIGAVKP